MPQSLAMNPSFQEAPIRQNPVTVTLVASIASRLGLCIR